jgi:predicted transport protein
LQYISGEKKYVAFRALINILDVTALKAFKGGEEVKILR